MTVVQAANHSRVAPVWRRTPPPTEPSRPWNTERMWMLPWLCVCWGLCVYECVLDQVLSMSLCYKVLGLVQSWLTELYIFLDVFPVCYYKKSIWSLQEPVQMPWAVPGVLFGGFVAKKKQHWQNNEEDQWRRTYGWEHRSPQMALAVLSVTHQSFLDVNLFWLYLKFKSAKAFIWLLICVSN